MMSDRDRILQLERTVAGLVQQISGMPVRLADGGAGIGDHFQIVRGTYIEQLSPNTGIFRLTVTKELEQYSANPGAEIWVTNTPAQLSVSVGGYIWAIYSEGIDTLEGGEFPGDVTDRTDADTAEITLDDPDHGIAAGRRVDVTWAIGGGGTRTGMSVTLVAGAVITVDGGTGDDLPTGTYSCDVTLEEERVDWETMKTPFGHIPEFVAKITTPIAGSGDPAALGDPGVGTGTVYRLSQSGLSDLAAYSTFNFYEYLPVPSTIQSTPAIVNTFPYTAGAGLYPVEFMGTLLNGVFGDPDPEDTDPYAAFTITGFDVRGHGGWVAGDNQVQVHEAGGPPIWVDSSTFIGGGGDPFDPTDIENAINALEADKIDEGYCTTIVDSNPRHLHLDQITTDAGTTATGRDLAEFQIWMHHSGATLRTDAKWLSIGDYDGTDKIQLPGHEDGDWNFRTQSEWLKTADDYAVGAAADDMQFVVHFQPGTAMPIWKPVTGYSVSAGIQTLLNDGGTWRWGKQSPEDGDPGSVTVNSITGVTLSNVAGELHIEIEYSAITVYGTSGGSGSVNDTLTC